MLKKLTAKLLCVTMLFMMLILPPPAAAEDGPDYLQDIIFAVFDDGGNAEEFLRQRGYIPYLYDIQSGTGGAYVYIGYKTTKLAKRALTDIKITIIDTQSVSEHFEAMFSQDGYSYMVTAVRYIYEELIKSTGLMGLNATDELLDEYVGWGSEVWGYTTARVLSFIVPWTGLLGLGYMLFVEIWSGVNFPIDHAWSVYTTKASKFGAPILADFFIDSRSEVPGYETATSFCAETPMDMRFARAYCNSAHIQDDTDNLDWEPSYLHFKRAETAEIPDEKEYVSEITLFLYDTPKEELEALGYSVMDEVWANPTFYFRTMDKRIDGTCRIAYRTTHYKSKALTDIKLLSAVDYHSVARMLTYRGNTYMSAPLCELYKGRVALMANGLREDEIQRVDGERNALVNIYTTRAATCGEPIEAPLRAVYNYKFEEGYISAKWLFNDAALTNGVDVRSDRNYFLAFKGKTTPIEGKYISLVTAGAAKSKSGAFSNENFEDGQRDKECNAQMALSAQGATYCIAQNLADAVTTPLSCAAFVGYSRTDDETEAITDVILVGERDIAPEKALYVDGIKYALTEGATDLNCGVKGSEDVYIYTTTDPAAGAPIIDLNIVSDDAEAEKEGRELTASYNRDGRSRLRDAAENSAKRYLVKTRESYSRGRYVSSVFAAVGSSLYDARTSAAGYGYSNFFSETNYNETTGGDYVIIAQRYTDTLAQAIRGLITYHCNSNEHPETLDFNGITYYDSGGYDMNRGAGGKYIYLYYTKDKAAGDAICDIDGLPDLAVNNDGSYTVVCYNTQESANVNEGTDGEKRYIRYLRYDKNKEKALYIKSLDAVSTSPMSAGDALYYAARYAEEKSANPATVRGLWWLSAYEEYREILEYLGRRASSYACAMPIEYMNYCGMYLGYNLTVDKKDAIRDIKAVREDLNYIITDNATGAIYRAVGVRPIDQDFGGDLYFLYYTTSPSAGEPLTRDDLERGYVIEELTDYTKEETADEPYRKKYAHNVNFVSGSDKVSIEDW